MADIKNHEKRFLEFQKESGLIGQSEAMFQIFETIEQIAPSDISVLIIGESGTGKELVARAIHQKSQRSDKPLIIVNSGAIPEGIIESELFGHEKGAFTGAVGTRKGYFEMANNGTIFLDEIGDMPMNAQVKLLRILEGNEFSRVGSSETKRTNVRVVAATNRPLNRDVKDGNFRQDLYFRLRAVTIELPPLRKRKEDIPLLVKAFAENFVKQNKIVFKGFGISALKMMQNYDWPGNIRELKNLVESVIVLEKGEKINDQIILKHLDLVTHEDRNLPIPVNKPVDQVERELVYHALLDLTNEISQLKKLIVTKMFPPKQLKSWEPESQIFIPAEESHSIENSKSGEVKILPSLPEMERNLIKDTLSQYNGNKRKAAINLKISERTLYRKIKEYNLKF